MKREDFQTATWKRFTQHLEQRLEQLRESNDKEIPELKTARIRGQIRLVQELLSLEKSLGFADAPEDGDVLPPQ